MSKIQEIYVWTTKVRPTGYIPSNYTVWYRPLTSTTTTSDKSWNGNNFANLWVTFGAYHWISCANYSWNGDSLHSVRTYLYRSNVVGLPTWSRSRTYSLWIYQDNAASRQSAIYVFQWQASTNKMVLVWQWVDGWGGGYFISNYWYWTSRTIASTITWRWINMVITYNWSYFTFYINWASLTTWSYTLATWSTKLSIWWASENQAWNCFNWCISEVIVESKARTAQEVADYYNKTKSNYWL